MKSQLSVVQYKEVLWGGSTERSMRGPQYREDYFLGTGMDST